MPRLNLLCRNATTSTPTGELDEEAFRAFLQRFVDTKVGVYLASGGSGEGHALTRDEIRRIYRIGIEVCKGKVQHGRRATGRSAPFSTAKISRIKRLDGGLAGWDGNKT